MAPENIDASGKVVRLPALPQRIVSLVPSVTESLFALGLGERVVGVTEWCIHPARELVEVARVGGTKNPDRPSIGQLRPDLILANLEENREIDIRRLRASGLCVWVDFPNSVSGALEQLAWLADLGAPGARAKPIVEDLGRAIDKATIRPPTFQSCFLAVWKDPWMTISAATYAHDLLRHLGLQNVFGEATKRYPAVTLDEIVARKPEVLLLPDEPYSFVPEDVADLRRDLRERSTSYDPEIRIVDGTLTFWHGPRTTRALREGLPALKT